MRLHLVELPELCIWKFEERCMWCFLDKVCPQESAARFPSGAQQGEATVKTGHDKWIGRYWNNTNIRLVIGASNGSVDKQFTTTEAP